MTSQNRLHRDCRKSFWCAGLAIMSVAGLVALWAVPGTAQRNIETVTGQATVLRGDLLDIRPAGEGGVVVAAAEETQRVRLYGIAAPFLNQECKSRDNVTYPCGEYARDRLETLIDGQEVTCTITYVDVEGRQIGRCRTQRWKLNEAMIVFGWAMTYRHVGDDYIRLEEAAKKAERGLWAGSVEPPWNWHARNPDEVKFTGQPDGTGGDGNPPANANGQENANGQQ